MNAQANPDNRAMLFDDWPDADKAGWQIAQQPKDFRNSAIGYANRWRPSTRNLIELGYGHFLAWMNRSGQLNRSKAPANRINFDIVTAYWQAQQDAGLAPNTIAGRMQQLGDALQAIAPQHDWIWIRRGAYRLQSAATPVRDIASRMQPADDVLQLGIDMMHAAESDRFRTAADRATLCRDGLLISLLALTLLRLSNLASITIGGHLTQRGEGWWMSFDAAETKGNKRMEFSFPDQLVGQLERYIELHREVLLKCSRKALPTTNALWISQHGTHMTTSAIALQIKARTEAEFGTSINPHTFRHIGATTIATNDPEHSADIMSCLGHAAMSTSEAYYNKAKMVDAGRRYQETIEERRRQANLALV